MSISALDEYIFNVRRALWKKTGSMDAGDALAYPLAWYIRTGRASVMFLELLAQKSPVRVANNLLKGGSVEEAINRLKIYLGYPI